MSRSFVLGTGAWMPQCPDVASVLAGSHVLDEDSFDPTGFTPPACEEINSRLKRGTSLVSRMACEVACQALRDAGIDGSKARTVFGSAYGEAQIAIEQLEMMVTGDGQVSPARFKNSVHNTAAGVLSIAHKNTNPSLALACGPLSLAYTLLEAQMILREGAPYVVAVVGDEPTVEPLYYFGKYLPFAAAVVLGREPNDKRGDLALEPLQMTAPQVLPRLPSGLQRNPSAVALWLIQAIEARDLSTISVGTDDDEAWSVRLTGVENP